MTETIYKHKGQLISRMSDEQLLAETVSLEILKETNSDIETFKALCAQILRRMDKNHNLSDGLHECIECGVIYCLDCNKTWGADSHYCTSDCRESKQESGPSEDEISRVLFDRNEAQSINRENANARRFA